MPILFLPTARPQLVARALAEAATLGPLLVWLPAAASPEVRSSIPAGAEVLGSPARFFSEAEADALRGRGLELAVFPVSHDHRDLYEYDRVLFGLAAAGLPEYLALFKHIGRIRKALPSLEELREERRRLNAALAARTAEVVNRLVAFTGLAPGEVLKRIAEKEDAAEEAWVTASPRTAAEMARFYAENDFYLFCHSAENFFEGSRTMYAEELLALLRAGGAGPRRVLDFGAGIASLAQRLARAGHEVLACDLNQRLLDFFLFNCRRDGVTARTRNLLKEPGLPEGPFDLIIATDVLEHIPDPLPVAANLFRRLAPGGFFVVRLPEPEPTPLHVANLTAADLEMTLARAGGARRESGSDLLVFSNDR